MAPIKFEDNIREKLQEREIEPSKDAWKKLQSNLNPTPNKNTKKTIWFAIAASFIGIVIIASLLFKDDGSSITNTSDIVVENPENIDKDGKKESEIIVDAKTINIASKESKSVEKNEDPKTKKVVVKKENISDLAEISTDLVKENTGTSDLKNAETSTSLNSANKELLINSNVDEVVAQTQILQKDEKFGTIEEINILLLKAQRDIQTEKVLNVKKSKVDATALLNEVEDDLETSFRDKVFETLGDGIEKVKTAVVERNN